MPITAPLRVIQITDLHLKTKPGNRLWGVDVDAGLNAVLAHIRERQPPADFVLATGDLVGDEPDAYDRLLQALEPLGLPVYCLPGNHDFPATMSRTLRGGRVRRERYFIAGRWQFVLLDSSFPGTPDGHLAPRELGAAGHRAGDRSRTAYPGLPASQPLAGRCRLARHHDGEQRSGAVRSAGSLPAGPGGGLGTYSRRVCRPAWQCSTVGRPRHLGAIQTRRPGTAGGRSPARLPLVRALSRWRAEDRRGASGVADPPARPDSAGFGLMAMPV